MGTLDTEKGRFDSRERPCKMTVSKNNQSMKANKMIVLILLVLCTFSALVPSVHAQGAGGNAMSPIRNNNSASDIRGPFLKRFKNADEFYKADQVVNQESVGPGSVVHSTSGPVQMWPVPIPTAVSAVPTMRDQAITKNMLQTFGYPVSDTQFQLISRMNDNIMTEQLFDPEKAHWMATATAGSASNAAANSMASLAINQALSAIDFCKQFLTNFTAEPNNVWQRIRDQLFVPMAILLLLPGAVLAQVKAIVAQGSPVLVGEVHPFEGLFRSIVAIFLIPGTFLVINYGIDVANSLTYTIANEYFHIFGTDMYEDAKCAIIRAFPMNKPEWNRNSFNHKETPRYEGIGVWAPYEGYTLATARIDPCMGVEESRVPDEDVVQSKNINRLMMNGLNDTATISWNLACAFQMAFLYYLWCMGPVAAALWVWPVQALRGALASWIDGVITVCFWSLFWNTTILLMACFRGVGDSGTIIMTALIFLAVNSVKSAFDFAGLASAAVQDAASQAQKVANSAKGGGAGGGSGGGSSGGASQGGKSSGAGGHVGGSQGAGQGGGAHVGAQGGQHDSQHATPAGNAGAIASAGGSSDNATIGASPSKAGGDGLQGQLTGAGGAGDKAAGALGDKAAAGVDTGLPPTEGDSAAPSVGGVGGGKGAGDSAGLPPMGDVAAASAAAAGSGSIDSNASVTVGFSGGIGGSADSLNVNSSNSGSIGGSGLGSGSGAAGDALKGGIDGLLNAGASFIPSAAAGGILAGMGAPDALGLGAPAKSFDSLLGGDSKPISLGLDNPSNALPGSLLAAPVDGSKVGTGAEVFGATGPAANGDFYKHNADGQLALNGEGKPILDTGRIGEVPALSGNFANDPGAVSAQKTAADVMTMGDVTTDRLSRAMAEPQGAEYKSIADTVGVAPPILDAALHGNTSAGVMTAVGFGGTETAASFAAPTIANDTASMSIASNQQAQAIAGGDTGMLSRATVGMDSQAASQLLASPQMDAQFASTVSGYAQAREATGSYAQTDGQYASMASYGGVAQSIAPNMISGELSPAGSVAQSNGFVAPAAAVSNDLGAVSAHNAAADIMTMTHTSGAELQRALAAPGGAEYTQLAERFGAAPALVDAALHGSAAAAAVVETGFGRTEFARENAATSFTAHQSVEMYNSAASTYGAPAVQSAAMEMNVAAGQQILQNGTLDNQFAATVSSYRESSLSGNYTQADTGYVTSAGATPAVTASLVTGGADAPGALAASMGYSAPYRVGTDPGAVSAQRSAADIMVMTNTNPETLQRALANPSGAEYAQLSRSFGASPVLVDAALHGNASAAAIVETGFGHTHTAHQYAASSSTAQQSVGMYDTASTRYGEQTVQQAAQGDIGSAQAILQSTSLDQQFASTVQSYQQAYSDSGRSGTPSFANVNYGSVAPSGAQPVVTAALVGGDPSPVGGYATAAGYSAPYALPAGDANSATAQRMGADIMAMTHTSPQELRAAIAHPESQQYQQLAERIGASPALVDSALHGNMSAAVVASAGFGTTETARQYEGQSVTAAQSLAYTERAQEAAIASGAISGGMSGAEVVRAAAIGMDPGAGQAILGGTGLASQFTSTVAAYSAESSSGRGYIDATVVPNVSSGVAQAQDLGRGAMTVDQGYSGSAQPVSYTAYSGDQSSYPGYSGNPTPVVNDAGNTASQPQYSVGQPQQPYVADAAYREPANLGTPGIAEVASAAPWLADVSPDTSNHSHAQDDAYHEQQQQQQQQQQGVVYGGDTPQQAARSSRLADVLGGAAIAKIGGTGQKPTGGALVARPEGGDKGAQPQPQQVAVNKGLNPNAAKGRGKTQAELDEVQRRLLAEQRQNMPGNDGMA